MRALAAMEQTTAAECERLLALLSAGGLPTTCKFSPEALYDAALSDKKRANDTLALITVPTIGQGSIEMIDVAELARYMEMGAAL